MRHGSNEPLQHPDEESDLNLQKGINGLKNFQTVDVKCVLISEGLNEKRREGGISREIE